MNRFRHLCLGAILALSAAMLGSYAYAYDDTSPGIHIGNSHYSLDSIPSAISYAKGTVDYGKPNNYGLKRAQADVQDCYAHLAAGTPSAGAVTHCLGLDYAIFVRTLNMPGLPPSAALSYFDGAHLTARSAPYLAAMPEPERTAYVTSIMTPIAAALSLPLGRNGTV